MFFSQKMSWKCQALYMQSFSSTLEDCSAISTGWILSPLHIWWKFVSFSQCGLYLLFTNCISPLSDCCEGFSFGVLQSSSAWNICSFGKLSVHLASYSPGVVLWTQGGPMELPVAAQPSSAMFTSAGFFRTSVCIFLEVSIFWCICDIQVQGSTMLSSSHTAGWSLIFSNNVTFLTT